MSTSKKVTKQIWLFNLKLVTNKVKSPVQKNKSVAPTGIEPISSV